MDVEAIERDLIRTRTFHYTRCGYDRRLMELLPRHRIGGGRGRLEQTWHVLDINGEAILLLVGDDGIICRLRRQESDTWRGQWLLHERMPIELAPATSGGAEPCGEGAPPEPVDAVYLWVDGSDPDFQVQKLQAARRCGAPVETDRVDGRQFRDNNELRYSLRSLELHAPWIRHVHIVTNGQAPRWLNLDHPKLALVSHEAIFLDPRCLPTFSSHAIELNLNRVPRLSRYFIYFNDDMLLGRDLRPDDFLADDGVLKVYQEGWPLPTDPISGSVHDRAYAHTQALLNGVLPFQPYRRALAHTPQVHDRELMSEVQDRWRHEVNSTAARPFRSPQDVAFEILYAYYALESPAHRARHRPVVVHNGSEDYKLLMLERHVGRMMDDLEEISFQRPKFICLNDDLDNSEEAGLVLNECRRFLEAMFPRPSCFERTGE